MALYSYNFTDRMAAAKTAAQEVRNRGLAGGRQGWRVFKVASYAPVDSAAYGHLWPSVGDCDGTLAGGP